MSWLSRIKNNFIALATGTGATQPIVNNPTTPVEKVLNAAGALVLPIAAALPGANAAALDVKSISQAVNDVSGKVTSPASDPIGNIAAVIGQGAHAAIDQYLTAHIGPQSVTFTDDALQALATIALSRTQAAQSVSPDSLGHALSNFLAGLAQPVSTSTGSVAPRPAPVSPPAL